MKADKDQIRVWRLDELPGLELRSGVAVTAPYPRHWHEEYQLCLIQAGGGELFYRGVHHNTPTTSLFIVHPGEVHSNHTDIGCSFRSIYVAPGLMQKRRFSLPNREHSFPFFPNPLVFDTEIVSLFQRLHHSRETPLERESMLLAMLSKLIERYAENSCAGKDFGKEHAAVKEVRNYLTEHHARNVSLKELGRVAHLSPFHLTRVFTKEVGMPPHAFQTQVRITIAKRLLRGGMPLSSVANTIGFADQSHFIRHFKRLMKITPGEYLKNSKNVQYGTRALS